ncbi:MAG TPA: DNA gyrase subunit A [Gemmatimonas aurantiaca]|uniref:DNA gyrase subunit A n=2 Tax=Gemmatimonas aurantiaca TaxID=173480 RepID=C1A5L6_GEMAT|nr:DNA gyrase subunit A [Gemmatimonas aurantiaca]BAH37526.1 DNA gyrase subunit A [Gemmatimonas aurantiaca T-27]HCT58558.1 DNA gyrase subunit A [Gemmatimonas aurantiaca]
MTAPNARERILPRLIDEEVKESFINYSMSVIVSRALPDVRDGLKPVHRRVLYAMNELGLLPGRAYKKSATVVGDVLGKYHPHGDSSVYDALVRMVQTFSLRYPLVDGQGNFGSMDGDNAAAYRYTEARLTRMAVEMLTDIDKNTVDFAPNFDDRLEEPRVLPAGFPNLLVNGSTGIAVGMATNIPPHNLREVISAVIALIDNPELDGPALRKLVKGPDFPTGGYIYGRAGIADYQDTGRGRIIMRARAVIEEKESSGKSQIVVTEVPYQVNKAKLVADIAELVRDQKLTGISALRDESDKDGVRVVIELKRDAIPRVVLNQLYKHTAMQSTFGVIMLALVPDPHTRQLVPKVLTLRQCLEHYIAHRHEVIVRRTQFDLDKALEREHILEGLKIAVDNIDEVIALIRAASDTPTASAQLQSRFGLSERQAEAILNMRLAKLTGLERDKLEEELVEVRAFILEMRGILESRDRRMSILKGELIQVAETYGDERRTEIVSDEGEFSIEDLIAEEEMVVTITHGGYIKRTPLSLYNRQGRGGRGKASADLKEHDFIERFYVASTHTYMLIFTDDGRCFWLKVHELPQAGRNTRGKPIVNLINVTPDTRIRAIVVTKEFSDTEFLLFCTRNGTVKKTALSQYSNPRANGIKAIKIEQDDELMDVQVTSGNNDVVLATRHGLSVRFHESDVREMGRDTTGVKGIELRPSDQLVGMVVIKREATLLVVTERGLGKCSEVSEYRVQKRGGKGILTLNRTVKTGDVIALMEVVPEDELMLMTRQGIAIRSKVSEIRVTGRAAQGVKLVALDDLDGVSAVARVIPDDKEGEGEGEESGATTMEGDAE